MRDHDKGRCHCCGVSGVPVSSSSEITCRFGARQQVEVQEKISRLEKRLPHRHFCCSFDDSHQLSVIATAVVGCNSEL